MIMTNTRHTAATGIVLAHILPEHWQHLDTNDGRRAQVGPVYKTKAEALADHEDYMVRAGWLKDWLKTPAPVQALSPELRDQLKTVIDFAARSREEYKSTSEWTSTKDHSCQTIRVPTALLNRIKEIEELM